MKSKLVYCEVEEGRFTAQLSAMRTRDEQGIWFDEVTIDSLTYAGKELEQPQRGLFSTFFLAVWDVNDFDWDS